ncbi:MAG TPA: peptidoglycan-binding protein LysM [Thermoanaerobaculia bacterium]|nr:peptidoglycan-binding protein LysM [Thermoanaerobaculia bacterium]
MGLFDFILGKGKKVAEPAAPQAHQVSPEEFQKLRNQKRAEALVKEVEALELGIEELKVEVDGAQAIVFGKAPTQAVREKAVLAIGNTDIIEKVDDRMEVVAVEAAAVFYTVKSGDTLSKIAKEFYGKAMAYPKIFEANRPMLTDPDKIYPGQVLRIPDVEPKS